MEKIGKAVWKWLERIAKVVVFWFCGLVKIKITEEQWDKLMQFVKFCVVGLSNFIISYVVYAVAILLGAHWMVGSVLGFIISVLNSFYWNNKYVFKTEGGEQRSWWKALIKTYVSYAFSGLLLANALLYLWNDVLMIPELWGPVINLLVTTPINFVINKLWAFRAHGSENETDSEKSAAASENVNVK